MRIGRSTVVMVGNLSPSRLIPACIHTLILPSLILDLYRQVFQTKEGPRLTGNHQVLPHEWNDEDELYPALQKLKRKNPNLKTLISIGGWNFNEPNSKYSGKWTHQLFSKMAASRSSRQEFIKSAINFAQKHGFDGIDVDWEYPGDMRQGGNVNGADDFGNYLTLLAEFRSAISGKNLLLTIAAPAIVTTGVPNNSPYKKPQKYFQWLGNCAKYLDWLNIMAYDYHGAFDSQTGVLAPLLKDSVPNGEYCLKNTIDAYLNIAKIPPKKLVLGIATYGRTFKVSGLTSNNNEPNKPSKGPGSAGSATKEPGVLAYYEIKQRLSNNQLTRVWHKPTHTPYAYSSATGEWITYEDEKSVCYKTSYLISKGLGGAMVWAIAQDDFKQGFPLQRKIKEILENPAKGCPIIPDSSSSQNPGSPSIPDSASSQNPLTPFILKESDSLDNFVYAVDSKTKTDFSPITTLPLPSHKDLDKYFHHVNMSESDANLIRQNWSEIEKRTRQYNRSKNSHSLNHLQQLKSQLKTLIGSIESRFQKNADGWKLASFYQVALLLYTSIHLEWITINFLNSNLGTARLPGNVGQHNPSEKNRQNQDKNQEKCELEVQKTINTIDNFIKVLDELRNKWPNKDIGPINQVLEGDKATQTSKPSKPPTNPPKSPKSPKSHKSHKSPESSSEDKYSYFVELKFEITKGKQQAFGDKEFIKMTIKFYSTDKKQKLAEYVMVYNGPTDQRNMAFLITVRGHAEFNYGIEWLVNQKWDAKLVAYKSEDYIKNLINGLLSWRIKILEKLANPGEKSPPILPLNTIQMNFQDRNSEDIGNAIFTFDEKFRDNIISVLPKESYDTYWRFR